MGGNEGRHQDKTGCKAQSSDGLVDGEQSVSRCPSFGEHSKTDLAVSEQQNAMISVFARCDPDEPEQDGSEFERVDVLLEPPSVLDDGGPVLGSESWDHVVGRVSWVCREGCLDATPLHRRTHMH